MTGTLTLPAGTSLRLPANERLPIAGSPISDRRMSFPRQIHCKSATRAFTETTSAVRTRKSGSLYDVLRVKSNASPAEIKKAYRSLAKQYHPDTSSSDESDGQHFMEIRNAYATLSDPMAKAMYDMSSGAGSVTRRQYGYRRGVYQTRKWETDQCW